ncbi:MAG: hypothetical protein JNM82_12620 [Rhodocyclaceae bacterium]|nr:hypothetical protein [Rhodocyclaceae bacterium]
MKALQTLAAATLLAGCATLADAGSTADVAVIDRSTGERLPTWRHEGRLYVAGTPGNRYAVELRNRTGGRILAVLSVDGVNAVTGQTATASQSGYVLAPGSRAEIAGWRKSMDDVAAFYFTSLPDSYAARTGRPDNVGVIGVAVYRERVEPRPELDAPLSRREAGRAAGDAGGSNAAPAAQAPATPATRDSAESKAAAEERLGTGHGERMNSPTRYTEFRRAGERPSEVITIHYDSRANLVAQGIIPGPRQPLPRAFPGGFVPDPT